MDRIRRGCGRKREDIRLQTAQMHAALSVARLATAVARMVSNCQSESTNANNTIMTGIGKDEHRKMHAAIASAAALVAASCSEAAKLTGASREQISTVIHMGMETRSLGDLLMLTTSAATCLKGANAFKMRNRAISNYAFEDLMSNQKDVRLPIRTPDGKIHIRMVSVHCKHDKIILNLGKEHNIIFDEHGGATDFSYPTDEHSYHAINLATSGGNIQLLFEEHEQYSTWKSFIRYLIINKISRLSY
uniref:VAN3-binding protein-like auxin canalisation domain-containing protein n=1 Tax=Oryza meridionalis TaxID=40149 RepID=A0A0E0CPZ9_9ORYZ